MMTPRRAIRLLLVVLVAGVVIGYTIFAFIPFLRGPQIAILSPADGSTATTTLTTVSGTARGVSYLYLDDRQIFTDAEGRWSEPLLLYPGYNILVVRARDRFGRTAMQSLQLTYLEAATSSPVASTTPPISNQ